MEKRWHFPLNLASLHGTTKGEDIFKAVENSVREYGGFAKLSAVVTDEAPAMQGTKSGFAGQLQKSGINCPVLQCIIHLSRCTHEGGTGTRRRGYKLIVFNGDIKAGQGMTDMDRNTGESQVDQTQSN